eukprot:scaffold5747_cov126-Cylindrotheca_fusiformis.AAC.4
MGVRPADGVARSKDDTGHDTKPERVSICGAAEVLRVLVDSSTGELAVLGHAVVSLRHEWDIPGWTFASRASQRVNTSRVDAVDSFG